jgi:hypothetical protein
LTNEDKLVEVVLISPFKLRHRVFASELQKNSININCVMIENHKKSLSRLLNGFCSISKVLDLYLSVVEFIMIGKQNIHDTEKIYIRTINDIQIVDTVNRIHPDAVIVYGGSIIPNKILQNITVPFINIHGAVLPGYRGLDSHWWLELDSKKYLQGYTIHFLESGIDTGNIILSKRYSGFRNCVSRNTKWRLWIAKKSASDVANLLKNDLNTAPSIKHDLSKSTYRSRISLYNFILSRRKD